MGRRAAAAALIVAPCWADGGGEGAALPPEESCVDHCGSWAESCWCNEKCDQQDNWLWGCCADYAAVCGGGGGGGGSCPRVGGRCGDYSCDEWIRWKPSEYTCQSLEERWGCDCTGCKECGGPAPKPAGTAALRLLPESDYPEARCLDGSQAADDRIGAPPPSTPPLPRARSRSASAATPTGLRGPWPRACAARPRGCPARSVSVPPRVRGGAPWDRDREGGHADTCVLPS
ncbi:unnamed protein product [Prorocentrum cordatum]|uniref:SMB domain-containing protein n=1 Tax=Prorocentrum cordatum TaxID=2364126 RepID=A0ABN9PCT8_9DINO|nr:unnamed protein product [Polarella glacialis]